MRLRTTILCLSLLASTSPSISATPPKAGAVCAKAGLSQNYLGKKYTCIKSGKKIVWDAGVPIRITAPKPSPIPTPTPTPTPSSSPEPSSVPTKSFLLGITPNSNLSNGVISTGNTLEFDLKLFTNADLVDVQGFIINSKGDSSIKGFSNQLEGDARNGTWRVSFKISSDQSPGDYVTKFVIVSSTGLKQNLSDIPFQVISSINGIQTKPLDGKPSPTSSSSASPSPSANSVLEGGTCQELGKRINNSLGFLECRYVKGKILNWIQLSTKPISFTNPKSAQNVSSCKIKGEYDGNGLSGFVNDITLMGRPGNLNPRINPPLGVNNAIIVPIAFPDLPGDANIREVVQTNREKFISWIKYFSDGKLSFNLDYLDYWFKMPKETSYYNLLNYDGANENRTTQSGSTRIAQLYIDELTKSLDLTKYRTIFVLYPTNNSKLTVDLVPRMVTFKLKEGERQMSLFANPTGEIRDGKVVPSYDSALATPPWAFWIHEIAHDWGLYGHAPGNGWSIGIMTNQAGISNSLNAWERFLLSWMPDELVYCETKATLQPATLQLSPLERADRQTKMIAVALDEHRLLVVEAHGVGDWYSRRAEQTEENGRSLRYTFWDSGYYSILAYVVDTNYRATMMPAVTPEGYGLDIDNGVNPDIPRYAYLLKVDGGKGSNYYPLYPNDNPPLDYSAFVAVQGDTFTFEGVKIDFVKTGDYETVKISRA